MLKFWRKYIELQLQYNLDRLLEFSIKDFHFPGLNYVCFDFKPGVYAHRLYIIHPSSGLSTTDVNIHNHLYDSQILVLHGDIVNTTYRLDNAREDFNIYSLTSALCPTNKDKEIKLELITKRGLIVDQRKLLRPGDMHFQPHTEIHNVENDPQQLTGFMVFEFTTVKSNSRIFTKKDYGTTIPTPGAYNKYTEKELKAVVQDLLDSMSYEERMRDKARTICNQTFTEA